MAPSSQSLGFLPIWHWLWIPAGVLSRQRTTTPSSAQATSTNPLQGMSQSWCA